MRLPGQDTASAHRPAPAPHPPPAPAPPPYNAGGWGVGLEEGGAGRGARADTRPDPRPRTDTRPSHNAAGSVGGGEGSGGYGAFRGSAGANGAVSHGQAKPVSQILPVPLGASPRSEAGPSLARDGGEGGGHRYGEGGSPAFRGSIGGAMEAVGAIQAVGAIGPVHRSEAGPPWGSSEFATSNSRGLSMETAAHRPQFDQDQSVGTSLGGLGGGGGRGGHRFGGMRSVRQSAGESAGHD